MFAKKSRIVILLVIITAVVATISWYGIMPLKARDTSGKWLRYSNTRIGFSLEYPSDEIVPSPEEEGAMAVKMSSINEASQGGAKEINAGLYPNVPAQVTSVDQFLDPTGMGVAKTELHARDIMVASEQAVIYGGQDGPSSDKMTQVLFFHEGHMWFISMRNIPADQEEHIWRSFRFIK